MSESASALFSIADANEFRFARFYIVCEAVPLGTLGNPLIVCGLSDTFRGLSKRGRDTESDAKARREEMHAFFSTNIPSALPSKSRGVIFLSYLLIYPGRLPLQAAASSFEIGLKMTGGFYIIKGRNVRSGEKPDNPSQENEGY